ncbi:MAG: ABC transporter ATP-binding protein [Firmicutes bacterium]|nr:ABC transporter ATP-binding protein [Bacillota bacterium]
MLKITQLTKSYDKKTKALDNLDIEIKKGELIGFIGPNGAGKTTTLKIITGIITADQGSVEIDGHNLATEMIAAKKSFTFVPDHPEIYESISGIDYLNFIADIYDISIEDRQKRILKFSTKFQLEEALGKKINTYSHGMKQKLLITAALLPQAPLFILDEPHVGLDPHSSRVLKDLMLEHCANGGSVLFSSHVLEVVENLCHKIAIIDKGKLIAYDTLENIKKNKDVSLEDTFLEMTDHE